MKAIYGLFPMGFLREKTGWHINSINILNVYIYIETVFK